MDSVVETFQLSQNISASPKWLLSALFRYSRKLWSVWFRTFVWNEDISSH